MDYQDNQFNQQPTNQNTSFGTEPPIEVHDYTVNGIPFDAQKKKRHGLGAKVAALCLSCALVGGGVGGTAVYFFGGMQPGSGGTLVTGNRTPTTLNSISIDTNKQLTQAEIYAKYVNSTVGITVDTVATNMFGQTVTSAAAGSGFVITDDGYIITNYHVIENANSITVTFVDGTSYPGKLVGGEKDNDIAVIKIEATNLTPVVLGSSDNTYVGEAVCTIGNPLGELTFTLTSGVVSALNRNITFSDGSKLNMLQTDCAINSGNSGGALFNSYGEVIGIVSAKLSSSNTYTGAASIEGLGFAIPINDVSDMIQDIITNGYVTGKPFMGIGIDTVDSSLQQYGLPAGAVAKMVTPGLSAAKSGMQEGDIITAVNDTQITSSDELIDAVSEYKAGDTVTLSIFRSGDKLTLTVPLDEENDQTSKVYQDYYNQKQQQLQKEQQEQQRKQQQSGNGYYNWPYSFGF